MLKIIPGEMHIFDGCFNAYRVIALLITPEGKIMKKRAYFLENFYEPVKDFIKDLIYSLHLFCC